MPGRARDVQRSIADTYFDVLAHDVANLISPIMVHAEFISLDKDLPKEARGSAAKMVWPIRRTANFILSFRMLHEALTNPPTEPEVIDVRGLVSLIQETVASDYPFKNPAISLTPSSEPTPTAVGAEYIGRILVGLMDIAVRSATRQDVDVKISFLAVKGEDDRGIWRCAVEDDGPGVQDGAKKQLVTPFEATVRLERRSPSSLMVYSAILRQLGGRLDIEDRVQGDTKRGTRAIIEVPLPEVTQQPSDTGLARREEEHGQDVGSAHGPLDMT